jgi:D-glycero-alpha-D-manno-heptose 1-phosphate guanylyltransferase
MMHAIVLAGGLGTRLAAVSGGMCKPLVEVGGRPFVEYVLDELVSWRIRHLTIAASYRWEDMYRWLGSEYRGYPVHWSIEREPLGTGGGMRQAFEQSRAQEALVVNADTFFDVDFDAMLRLHRQTDAAITLALRSVHDVGRYGGVTLDADGRICRFEEKGRHGPGLINGGTYFVDTRVWDSAPAGRFSFESDVLQARVRDLPMFGFHSEGYFIDIGIPEDLERARRDFARGTPRL